MYIGRRGYLGVQIDWPEFKGFKDCLKCEGFPWCYLVLALVLGAVAYFGNSVKSKIISAIGSLGCIASLGMMIYCYTEKKEEENGGIVGGRYVGNFEIDPKWFAGTIPTSLKCEEEPELVEGGAWKIKITELRKADTGEAVPGMLVVNYDSEELELLTVVHRVEMGKHCATDIDCGMPTWEDPATVSNTFGKPVKIGYNCHGVTRTCQIMSEECEPYEVNCGENRRAVFIPGVAEGDTVEVRFKKKGTGIVRVYVGLIVPSPESGYELIDCKGDKSVQFIPLDGNCKDGCKYNPEKEEFSEAAFNLGCVCVKKYGKKRTTL